MLKSCTARNQTTHFIIRDENCCGAALIFRHYSRARAKRTRVNFGARVQVNGRHRSCASLMMDNDDDDDLHHSRAVIINTHARARALFYTRSRRF